MQPPARRTAADRASARRRAGSRSAPRYQRRLARVAVQHRAADPVVLENHSACRCRGGDPTAPATRGVGPREKSPAENRSMPVTLSCVAVSEPRYRVTPISADVLRADARLFPQRRHQAVGLSAMLHAFAHGVDGRVEGLQRVVDQDAAVAVQAARAARSMLGRMPAAITTRSAGSLARRLEAQRRSTRSPPSDGLRSWRACEIRCRASPALPCSSVPAGVVELPFHQRVAEVHDGDVHAALGKPVAASSPSRPPPITTARRPLPRRLRACASTSSRSRNVTTPGRSLPGTGSTIGIGAGREQQPVVRRVDALARRSRGVAGGRSRRPDRRRAA